jgi:hypothetical protein
MKAGRPQDHKDIIMSIKTFSLRAGALALFATFALAAAEPASAASAKPEIAKSQIVKSSITDVSAARRDRHVQRRSVRNAYGAYVGGSSAAPAQTWNNYGNGVGDNSRNQTW